MPNVFFQRIALALVVGLVAGAFLIDQGVRYGPAESVRCVAAMVVGAAVVSCFTTTEQP